MELAAQAAGDANGVRNCVIERSEAGGVSRRITTPVPNDVLALAQKVP